MKKFISALNRADGDITSAFCLLATLLCGITALTGIARSASVMRRFVSVKNIELISYPDVLSGETVLPTTLPEVLAQLALTAMPACLCFLAFRGLSRPVRKGSLVTAGVCLIITGVLLMPEILFFIRFGMFDPMLICAMVVCY